MDKILKIAKETGISILLILLAIVLSVILFRIKQVTDFQFWGLFSLIFICVILSFFALRKKGVEYSSSEWFDLIIERLEDNENAQIFLREFQHPDRFHEKHRKHLLKIMDIIKQKMLNEAEIKIIAYHPNNEKDGYDWLKNELAGSDKALKHLERMIKIIRKQPFGSNSSSAYIFSDKSVLYNQRTNGKVMYHFKALSNSILFDFIRLGYNHTGASDE